MERKYALCKKYQIISLIGYAISLVVLYWMMYADLSNRVIRITGIVAMAMLVTNVAFAIARGIVGYKMGHKSTRRDWLMVCIALVIVTLYYAYRSFR